VQFPILGVDFLRHHGLLVDPACNQLVDGPLCAAGGGLGCLTCKSALRVSWDILGGRPHLWQFGSRYPGPPIASRFRRLECAKLEAARREFEAMEREWIIERSTSPWASPLHMVPKKDGSWRPCGDFRRLNLVTEADVYPLPNMLDFSDRLSGCSVFSKIDLRKGYW
jgi:hypothetical protein